MTGNILQMGGLTAVSFDLFNCGMGEVVVVMMIGGGGDWW